MLRSTTKELGGMNMKGERTVGVAGIGKMGTALVRGLIVGHVVSRSNLLVSDLVAARAAEVAERFGGGSVPVPPALAREADVVVLAAKPKDMPGLVRSIADAVPTDALVISLAAGVRTAFIESALRGRGRVVRVMPNLACAVGEGATAFALGSTASPSDALVVEEIFGGLGRVTKGDEALLDAATGLRGSGAGAAPAPGGTREAGGAIREARGVPQAIRDGIVAAARRAAELAEEVAGAGLPD